MRTRLLASLALAALALAATLACGKKAPPLPPLEGSTPRIGDLEVRQLGEETRAYFTMPIRPEADEVDYITTGVELWRRPAEAGASKGAQRLEAAGVPEFTKSATLVDSAEKEGLFDVLALEHPWLRDLEAVSEAGLVYEYALVLRTNLRKRGTLSNVVVLEPVPPPARPLDLKLDPQESGIVLTWTVPGFAARPAPEAGSAEAAEGAEGAAPSAPVEAPQLAFNVYRALDDREFAPESLNEKPIREPRWADADVTEGVTYRYLVRSVIDAEGSPVLSGATEELSFLYRDIFPPAVPAGLRLIPQGSEVVNLIWSPNAERDLAGYAVYRREEGAAWERLDDGNVRSAGYVDRKLTPGRNYEYAVAAFDDASPMNESERSEVKAASIPGP